MKRFAGPILCLIMAGAAWIPAVKPQRLAETGLWLMLAMFIYLWIREDRS